MGVTITGQPALPASSYSTRPETAYLVVHCSATPRRMDIGVEEIRHWHVDERGWLDVGYHYVIRRSGEIERGRPRTATGAHVGGFNSRSIGICMVGGGKTREDGDYTDSQWASLRALLAELKTIYPAAQVMGHRDFPAVHKYCPSFDVRQWWAANRPR